MKSETKDSVGFGSNSLLTLLSARARQNIRMTGDLNPLSGEFPIAAPPDAAEETRSPGMARIFVPGASLNNVSPLADIVLKEAKRRLGSRDYEMHDGQSVSEEDASRAVDEALCAKGVTIDDICRANIIVNLLQDLDGWAILQPLIDHPNVTDIHCYDYRTVVLQRGKKSELTGLQWPSDEAYRSFIDRLLLKVGKSLSTAQHTVDAAFPDGKRICAVDESVCSTGGPLLTVRIPRIKNLSLETLYSYQVAPPLILSYLAALVQTAEHTMIVSGETGTGKTTLIRCLGTQFRDDESIIAVEDTPEVNYQHRFFRGLAARPANSEGIGEVSLQDHIKASLRLCPTRVILGEMRTPEAAESFLESAQTGHCGMSTIHARNARETLTRLEALLGRAQRGVNMEIIRQQIALAVDLVVWMMREKKSGRVRIAEVLEIGNYVEGNIQVRPMFRLIHEGERPCWEVLSWSSLYEEALLRHGVHLGGQQKYLSFSEEDYPAALPGMIGGET